MAPSNGSTDYTPFAYQTRLLERTSSRTGSINLSRTASISSNSSASATATRRWTPSHRVAQSLESIRGKWEERARQAEEPDTDRPAPPTPTKGTLSRSSSVTSTSSSQPHPSETHHPNPKRFTLPAHIVANPLSPNTTGISIESPDYEAFSPSTPNRIRLPSTTSLSSSSVSTVKELSGYAVSTDSPTPPRPRRATTLDNPSYRSTDSLSDMNNIPSPSRRPLSVYGNPSPSLDKPNVNRDLPAPSGPSVMTPAPYRSSYMANKKASTYGHLASRKLGRHLPRIASGDAEEPWNENDSSHPADDDDHAQPSHPSPRRAHTNHQRDPYSPSAKQEFVVPGVTNADDVAGIPGRLRLSREIAPAGDASVLQRAPAARYTRALWADTQRHLIQAYEYLCHVGEAQQWIEGCLNEELGFGVVEMEEGLRNGVVLAKLVRAFTGEKVVRRIYDARKLDFRHSDNINYFFVFVREAGLPEGFIFELTDLYDKKNIPKVIYCIHALSHLLARRGLAERIGNLIGQLQFSDDQLQRTQKGLNDAGVAMPNFGNIGRELAKEINEEPEPEPEETEDERIHRELLECEPSIAALQRVVRGFLVRKAIATQRGRLRLTERYVPKLQAQLRATLVRKFIAQTRDRRASLVPWATQLQALARGAIIRGRWRAYQRRVRALSMMAIKLQAQARGVLQRRKYVKFRKALRSASPLVLKLQSTARARVAQRGHKQVTKTFAKTEVARSVVTFQSAARGALTRRRAAEQQKVFEAAGFEYVQAQCRGVLVRRRVRAQLATLEDVVTSVQAAVRTYLARKRLLTLIRGLRRVTPLLIGIQSVARAGLARRAHHDIGKALGEIRVVGGVQTFQALARAALTRNKHREQTKQLTFVEPDVRGLQSLARGFLVRRDYFAWRDHLWASVPVAVALQALLRGVLQRRKFRQKMAYYRANLDKVVKIQSLYRAKETREQYRALTLGKNVTVGTIKNFVHLLDDSEADFREEIRVERLRKRVVEGIRENQALEHDVSDLDTKIALVVQNVKSFEELVKARRHGDSAAAHASRATILAAHGDPFAGPNTLDHSARKKLELYQQLFYLLQSRGEYLSKLFAQMGKGDAIEKNRRLAERVVLTLFGYGQDRREDYLLLRLFQLSIKDEIKSAESVSDIVHGHPMYINIAVHYVRPKQVTYVRETLQTIMRELVDAVDLDLEADPSVIHRSRIDIEEMRSGQASTKPKDVPFYEALKDPDTRAEYIRHLQKLQWWTEAFAAAIMQSTKRMPYSMRFLARETLNSLREHFPDASDQEYASCIARLVFYRYMNPAILTPETFDMVSHTVDVATRKNLAQISRVLSQVASGAEFTDDNPSYMPINEYVRKGVGQMTAWMLQIADVPDAETYYRAHEFLDATVQPKPIYISPNEVYGMHALLSQYQDQLCPSREDTLNIILRELDGVPHLDNDELKDARDRNITLELTNRFAHVKDPQADEKALWVQAKRLVLAILRVQPAQDLVESLMKTVTDDDEIRWEEIVSEMENEPMSRRMPSTAGGETSYRLEDIRSLSFREIKAHAIFFLLELEKQDKITRNDGFQGILNAIASDVRSKHLKRLQRQQEMDSMNEALKHLQERKKNFQEQIDSYHNYVEAAMATMQRGKGKKRFVIPFTKQYFHMRDLQKSGKSAQFGSFKYTAKDLYDKGILLSIDQYSPRQFDKIDLILSSNKAGIFTIEVFNNNLGLTNRIATQDLRMEDLLQAQFENQASLSLFNGLAKANLSLLLYQINKKFYV